jgi:methionyl-tRNA formyltransferase
MKIEILGNQNTHAYRLASTLINRLGHKIVNRTELIPDVAVAPLLTDRLTKDELQYPAFGTLIFHPSPLPYGRGVSAIRWAYRRREPITAATWFWANEYLDAGDICEQEIIKIDYNLRPRTFYEQEILPAMIRTLERAVNAISAGYRRKIPQIEQYSTYDGIIK